MPNIIVSVLILAGIIAAEAPAGNCSLEARVVVANVAMNRLDQPWIQSIDEGWNVSPDPDPQAVMIAYAAITRSIPDWTDGSVFLFGPGDVEKIAPNGALPPWLERYKPHATWMCSSTFLQAWKRR